MGSRIVDEEAAEVDQMEASLAAGEAGVPEGVEEVPVEAPAAPEAAPEPDGGDAPEEQPAQERAGPPRHVPVFALQEERARRQAVEQELREARVQAEKFARLEERVKLLNEQRAYQAELERRQKAEAEIPNPISDPDAYNEWARRQENEVLRQEIAQSRETAEQAMLAAQQLQVEREVSTVVEQSRAMQDQFAEAVPDYWDAYRHMEAVRLRELTIQYGDPSVAAQVLEAQKAELVGTSARRGPDGRVYYWRNPAQVIYEMALAHGYTPRQARAQMQGPAPAAQRVAAAASRTRAAGASLSFPHGASPVARGSIDVSQLLDMDDATFAEMAERNPRMLDALMGRE